MIYVASTYVADVLNDDLKGILHKFCDQEVTFFYNQVFQQALLPDSEFHKNTDGLNVVLIQLFDLFKPSQDSPQNVIDFCNALASLQKSMKVPLLILVTPSQAQQINDNNYYYNLERELKFVLEVDKNTIFISSESILNTYNSPLIFDHFTEKHGHIPYTIEFYECLAMIIGRNYSLLTRKPYKVIVTDCDGTLWKGVIEEDGVTGIVIDNECQAYQQFLLDLFHSGFLLCLSSKNSEQSVCNVIAQRTDMRLHIDEHICSYRINWLPKSVNIESLAQELNLSLDSFIFIDDNAVECAEVKAAHPEVLVIELPATSRLHYLKNIWAFDKRNLSNEDQHRMVFYKQNKLRDSLQLESISYEHFLKNLEIKTHIHEASVDDLERVIQLSQRTNQFNFFPNSVSPVEFSARIAKQHSSGCLVINVSDKFGDYGLVGVVVYDLLAEGLVLKSFFLSCRILGRGVEYTVIERLVKIAELHAEPRIKIVFKKTDRNIPAMQFIKYIAGQEQLENINCIIVPVDQLKHISPKLIEHVEHKTQSIKSLAAQSNDYMLELAKDYTKKTKNKVHSPQKLITVEMSLIELLKQYQLWVDKKDVSFIDLGITSLQCVLLASTIYQRFHVEITPFELLKPHFTLDKLTQYLLKQLKSHNLVPELTLEDSVASLSNTQLRLWEDEHIFPGTCRNNMFTAYEIEGPIESHIMERAFVRLMDHHDALRFSFFLDDEHPRLKLNSLQSIPFKIDYLVCDNEADIELLVRQFCQKPFDLAQPPLFRAALVSKGNKSIFLFSIHHIIHDGWSLNILLRELSEVYKAYSNQITLPVIAKTCPYLNFIRWQQNMLSAEVLEEQREFWKKYLLHIPKVELVYDRTRAEEQETPLNHRLTFRISSKTTRKLKKIALRNQVTLYDTLVSAFGLFLSHFTNQEDINFITAVSGRHHSSVAEVIGFFTNLVLIRMRLDNEETFADLIKKNQKLIHNIFNNQDLPFNEIIQLTGESVNSKIHAFNQVGFIFQSYPINHLIINDAVCHRVFADDKAELIYDACNECRFGNLVFFMQEYESKLHGMVEYNTHLLDEKRVKSMINSFKTFIDFLVNMQDEPARSIPVVSTKQHRQMFYQWNQFQLHDTHGVSLLGYFHQQVLAQGNAIAVIHNAVKLTYSELNKMTNQFARKLKKEGVAYEVPVGIFLGKNSTRIIAMLSIIKAGGCYVPLETDVPMNRISYIVDDSSISLIITDSETDPYIKKDVPNIKTIQVTDSSIRSESTRALRDLTTPQQLAYILYTSGSTGTPKGVAIEQRGIIRLVKSTNYVAINTGDRIAQASTFIFDAATFEIWGALLNGAAVVLIDKNILLDAHLLDELMHEQKISIMFLTTQLFHTYIQLAPRLFEQLNYLLVGGEAMLPETVERLFNQKLRPRYFINVYGPTENTTFSTGYLITRNADLHKPIPIGKPISGTQVYVLDDQLNPSPVGAPGTLYVGGTGLARGYINQPQLNNEKFIYYNHQRIYNTGDTVTWLPDGNLKFLGRKDNQIKINGYRIELDEIALQLETHHLVAQAVVLVKMQNHHKQLVCYVVLESGNDLHDVNLYHYLKTILPHYMLPKFYYQIDGLPVTQNGKVDKKLLLKTELPAVTYTEHEPAANILQENLISIYAEILDIPPTTISINAEFFDLGGTSISALHFIEKVNEQFKVNINFSTLYEHASVKALSETINAILSSEKHNSTFDVVGFNAKALKTINVGNPQRTPLVFIHPIGGTGFCYLDLIKLLPHTQPCYIIQDPSIDANQVLFADIPTMAKCYNELLLKHFDCRKVILSGYSFGGMLSLEMVSQLENQQLGKNIDRVITFDTWVVSDFMNVKAKEALKTSIMRQYERVALNLTSQNIDPKPWMELYYRRLQDLGFAYKPPTIHKKITLFKADQQLGEFSAMNDATNYLNNHTSEGVDVHLVSGDHDTILKDPHVRGIGRLLNDYLKGKIH